MTQSSNRHSRWALSWWLTRESLAVYVATAIGLLGLTIWHLRAVDQIERDFVAQQKEQVLLPKITQLQDMFATVYQNVRTISLLPSLRSVQGGNRIEKEQEDVVKGGRLSREGHQTVQSVYNNLVGLVSVSEIYAVIDGFDAGKGEIPFFMYDAVVFGSGTQDGDEAEEASGHSTDTPEESEEAEYAYFPKQIAQARQAHPTFNFARMDDIPAFASPLMRTCDNSQYPSVSKGNEHDSHGFIYSVPFYATEGAFKGVIAAIVRRNVLEAALLGVPFVPVTAEDKQKQQTAKWQMPGHANFVLSNDAHGLRISDRRQTKLWEQVQQGAAGRNVLTQQLNIASDSPWVLTYYISETAYDKATSGQRMLYGVLVGALLLAGAVASTAFFMLARMRYYLGGSPQTVANIVRSISTGDLNVDMPDDGSSTRSVMSSLRVMLHSMRALVGDIKTAAQSIHVAADSIVHSGQELTAHSEAQGHHLLETTTRIEELLTAVKENIGCANSANELAKTASQVVTEGGATTEKVVSNMGTIHASSRRIVDITGVVDSIAFQTNILALNAAVEAARAGNQGKGFAVVASEVRTLAQKSASAAKEIKQLISESVATVEDGKCLALESGQTMEQILASVGQVASIMEQIMSASTQQGASLDQISEAVQAIEHGANQNMRRVQNGLEIAQSLKQQSEELKAATDKFRV